MSHYENAKLEIDAAETASSQEISALATEVSRITRERDAEKAAHEVAEVNLVASTAKVAELTATVASQNILIAELKKQVPVVRPPMIVGASISDVDTTAAKVDARLGFQKAFRRFDTPPPKTVDTTRLWNISWKRDLVEVAAGKWDAEITAWAKALPAGAKVDYTMYHEPENDPWTGEQFKAAYRHLAGVVRAANSPAKVRFGVIYMAWTLDVIGWDLDGIAPKNGVYPDFIKHIPKIQAFSTKHGKPWCVPEFGSPRDAADVDGAKRVEWMKAQLAALSKAGCEYLCLFNYPTTPGYPLTTPLEVAYWKQASL
jgi:hypothetical protein